MSGDSSVNSSFHTDWQAINQAAHSEDVLHDLVTRYLKRLQRHARIQWYNLSPEDVEDFVQSFLVKMLGGGVFAGADQSKGRFRTFFLRCFDNHVRDHLKRPAGDEASLADFQLPEQETNEIWAIELFETAATSMRVECQNHGLSDIWDMALDRFINPILHGTEPLSYEQLQEKYKLVSQAATAGKIRTVKKRLDLAVRGTIATYAHDPEELDSEIRQFVAALPHQVRVEEPKITTAEFLHSNWRYDLAHYEATQKSAASSRAGLSSGTPISCELTWERGSPEAPTYVELFLAERPPITALTAVRDMAKQWIKHKVTEVPKHAQSAVYYIPAALAEHCYGMSITKLAKTDVMDRLTLLCQQAEDPLPDEVQDRVQVLVKAMR